MTITRPAFETAGFSSRSLRARQSLRGLILFCSLAGSTIPLWNTAHAADLSSRQAIPFDWLPWKNPLPKADLAILPIGPGHWQSEAFRYEPAIYRMAYGATGAVCWPDVKVCAGSDELFCEVVETGVPEIADGRQILVAKQVKTEQCLRREQLSRFGNSMHDTITYRSGSPQDLSIHSWSIQP
jgi:hypothetical protein